MFQSPIQGSPSMAGALPLGNQTVVVTGTDRGIGQHLAMELAVALGPGSLLICSAMASNDGHKEIGRIALQNQVRFEFVGADLRSKAGVDIIVSETRRICKESRRDPIVNGIVNVAGYTLEGSLAELTAEQFHEVMFLNTGAPIFLAQGFEDMLMNSSIVLYGSVQSIRVYGNTLVYACTKDMNNTTARQLAIALEGKARVNTLVLGWVPVERHFEKVGFDHVAEANGNPLGRLLHPSDINNVTMFLLSPFSGGITGASINVSGGAELRAPAGTK